PDAASGDPARPARPPSRARRDAPPHDRRARTRAAPVLTRGAGAAPPARRGRSAWVRRMPLRPRNRRRSPYVQTPGGTPRGEGSALRDVSRPPVTAAGHAGERGI